MKKIFISILFTLCLFIPVCSVSAEDTLDQLLAKAQANRAAYQKAKNQKELTEKEKADATNQKAQVESQIKTISAEIEKAQEQVKKLQESIDVKDKEIKNLMKFFQVSNGDPAYLEYAFGASSFTDFIYRVSVTEQLSNYNEQLIDDYNKTIKELEQKQKELNTKQSELSKKQQELSELEVKLNKEIEQIGEGMESKDEEYKTQITLINNLKKLKCKGNETMSQCSRRLVPQTSYSRSYSSSSSTGTTINANGLYMPIPRGYVTSGYGWRDMNGDGRYDEFHTGVDISGTGWGSPIYPVAAGTVVAIKVNPNYGNHMVYINHIINGVSYTTSYWHMHSHSVYVGQNVSPSTVIGTMGGGSGDNDYWAPGVHVHLNLFRGLVTTNNGRINPGTVLPIPAKGAYFTSPR